MNREEILGRLKEQSENLYDVVVIGGGATGLGVALDAATRGYSAVLLEQSDFSKATSSRSTKLVHGGVRYMAQGDFLLVIEALRERGILLRNAPHITFNQQFIIPLYSRFDVLKYTLGLKLYDLLAGKLSLGRSRFISRDETLERLPLLRRKGLKGGVVYHDGQFDDSRLSIDLVKKIYENGGLPVNYCRVTGFYKDNSGKITGVRAIDQITRKDVILKARLVVNATGVFADEISKLDDFSSEPTIRPSQGVHIVLPGRFLRSSSAIMIPKTEDGRVLFAIPWYNEVVVGTTDTPINEVSLEPVALEREIEFILRTAGLYLAEAPKREDILSIFAGLRPLAAIKGKSQATREISRRHKITFSSSGLLSIIGGKWTTYRQMAEETLDAAIRKGALEKRKCVTENLSLGTVPLGDALGRLSIYGKGAEEIKGMIQNDPEIGKHVHAMLPYTIAEIIWICRNEIVTCVEDILARRTRALFLNARSSIEMAPAIAKIMAAEMGFDENWRRTETEKFRLLANNYL
jgi:glycerol-3-phosphate dehydrogenase